MKTLINYKKVILGLSFLLVILASSIFVTSTDFVSDDGAYNGIIGNVECINAKYSDNAPKALAATQDKIVVSKSTVQSTIQYKQIFTTSKNSKSSNWINTSNSTDNHKYPNKKFRWAYDTFSTTTTKYTNITSSTVFPKNAKVTYTSSRDATVVEKNKISTRYENIANPYLSPCKSCHVFDPTLKKVAKSITKGKKDKAAADKILAYVQKRIVYEGYSNTKYAAFKTWKLKKGNCVDSSHLTVALLRAAGIPARYGNKGVYERFGHCWPEVYVTVKGKSQWLPGEATLIAGKVTKTSITAPFSKTALDWFIVDQFKYVKPDYQEKMVVYIW